MIMPAGQQLLLPAKSLFIWSSLLGAFGLDMLQNMALWGRAAWAPDFLALVLVFWIIHQPQRIGIGVAFMFGLFSDVYQGALLGQHALAYTILSFLVLSVQRRLPWFSLVSQAFQIFPLFFVSHMIGLGLRMLSGTAFPGLWVFAAPCIELLLWPLVSMVLLLPQKRPPNPDAHRPL